MGSQRDEVSREGAWESEEKGKGEGKVAGPHQWKFLRRHLEYYWHWANVTPTIVLPTARQLMISTNVTTVAQPYRLRWPSVTPDRHS